MKISGSNRIKSNPLRSPTQPTDLYVNRQTRFVAFYKRAIKVLDKHAFVTIHGLGAAIQMAVKLALAIKESNKVEWEISTHSIALYDSIMPKTEEEEPTVEERTNSAIRILIKKR